MSAEAKEEPRPFEDRRAGRYIISFPYPIPDVDYEWGVFTGVEWRSLPQDEDCHCSFTLRDDGEGFAVDMKNVKVCRSDCTVVESGNPFVLWLIKTFCKSW